jgi:hypothetical protein
LEKGLKIDPSRFEIKWVKNLEGSIFRPFPYVKATEDFFFWLPCIGKRQKLIKCEKRCKYENYRLLSLKTVPSEMRKAQYKLSHRLYWAFHISEGIAFNYSKIQARERPENIKEKSPLVFTQYRKRVYLKPFLDFRQQSLGRQARVFLKIWERCKDS